MWRSKSILLAVVALGTLPAAGQEQSTETACIERLRQSADRLATIEQRLARANRACIAEDQEKHQRDVDNLRGALAQAHRALRDRDAEIETLKDKAGRASNEASDAQRRLEGEQQRVDGLQAQNKSLRDELDGTRRQLNEMDSRVRGLVSLVNAAADQQVRPVLPTPRPGCGEQLTVNVADGVVTLSGRLVNADEVARRANEVIRSIPGATVRADNLARLDVCGQSLGDGWVVEVAEDGPRRIFLNQISSEILSRLPEGSDDMCRSIGAKIDQLSVPDVTLRREFWVKPPDRGVTVCRFLPPNGPWKMIDTQVNLNSTQALLVQRSR